ITAFEIQMLRVRDYLPIELIASFLAAIQVFRNHANRDATKLVVDGSFPFRGEKYQERHFDPSAASEAVRRWRFHWRLDATRFPLLNNGKCKVGLHTCVAGIF